MDIETSVLEHHLSSGSDLLDYLTVLDLTKIGACSRYLYHHKKMELERRIQRWIAGTSKSWAKHDDEDLEDVRFADDVPWEEAKTFLDSEFVRAFANGTQRDMFDRIAEWAGGWEAFLHAREEPYCRMILPPQLINDGRVVQFSTPGSEPTEPVLLYDLFCDENWIWSSVHPLFPDDYFWATRMTERGEREVLMFVPGDFTMTPGDSSDAATAHSFNNHCRPNKYHLSTSRSDTRSYRFRISIVSPECSETVILYSDSIIPAEIDLGRMIKNSGYGEGAALQQKLADETGYKGFRPDPRFFRTEVPVVLDKHDQHWLNDGGEVQQSECLMQGEYFLDLREGNEQRFHVTILATFMIETIYEMIARPRVLLDASR